MKQQRENHPAVMSGLLIAIAMLIVVMLCCIGCSTHKAAQPTIITLTDSVRVETKYEKIIIRDTVMFALPSQGAERTTLDSISHLETDFAVSDARVNPDGSLTHTLNNKSQEIPVPVESEKEMQEKIIYRNRDVAVPQPYPVEVERELTQWQKFRLKGFWVLLAVILASSGWKWRKPIFNFIRRFI